RPLADGLTYLDLDAAELSITAVKLLGAEPRNLAFETFAEKLRIELDVACGREEELTIEIAYSSRPRKGLYFVKPDDSYPHKPRQIWSQGQNEDAHFWFP